jgi:hypothetical protein
MYVALGRGERVSLLSREIEREACSAQQLHRQAAREAREKAG